MEKEFKCIKCGKPVSCEAVGTKNRNHCPNCLWSYHVDNEIGDRSSSCKAPMSPEALTQKKAGEIKIVHVCKKCSKISENRIAGDDNEEQIIGILEKSKENRSQIERKIGKEIFSDQKELKNQLFGK